MTNLEQRITILGIAIAIGLLLLVGVVILVLVFVMPKNVAGLQTQQKQKGSVMTSTRPCGCNRGIQHQ